MVCLKNLMVIPHKSQIQNGVRNVCRDNQLEVINSTTDALNLLSLQLLQTTISIKFAT